MALIEKLEAIGDAIRAKTGGTELLTLDAMPTEIAAIETGSGGEEYFADENLVFSGKCDYLFANDRWKTVLEKEKDRIVIKDVSSIANMFAYSTEEDYSYLIITGDGKTSCNATGLFADCRNLKKLPKVSNVVINSNQANGLISYMYSFNDTNQLIEFFDNNTFTNSTLQGFPIGSSLYSLRNLDAVMPYVKKAFANYSSGANYGNFCYNYFGLDEINNIPILGGTRTYGGFNQTFQGGARLKNITFETDNGAPIVAQWKSQTIDLAYSTNLIVGVYNKNSLLTNLLDYNSGITADKQVTDDATYQALKDDPDWFTTDVAYSRYNHDSAVNTINSLPDTSAYLAANGGTNTIKFKGEAGSKTDGGAINTLTDEEIAVAAAKGWTVSLV